MPHVFSNRTIWKSATQLHGNLIQEVWLYITHVLFILLCSSYFNIFPSLVLLRKWNVLTLIFPTSTTCFQKVVMFPTFYRLFPQEWPANLLPVSGSYCGRCHSGVALHLQERFPGPLPERKPCQPSQVNITIVIILLDIFIGYFYIVFPVYTI